MCILNLFNLYVFFSDTKIDTNSTSINTNSYFTWDGYQKLKIWDKKISYWLMFNLGELLWIIYETC